MADDETNTTVSITKASGFPTTPDVSPPVTAYDYIIRVQVGEKNQKVFEIHRGLLVFYSQYFAAALSTRWHTDTQHSISITDEDTDRFSIFHGWLYTRRLVRIKHNTETPLSILDAILMWTFGDIYGIPALKNQAMNLLLAQIIDIWRTFKTLEIDAVYACAPPGSKLRKFIVDFVIFTSHPDYEAKDQGIFSESIAEDWPLEFLFELACGFTVRAVDCERWTPEALDQSDWCVYHEHPDGVRCLSRS